MSYNRRLHSNMNDQVCLAESLKKLGMVPTILKEAETIRGHASERSQEKCDVILKKENTKRGADIGFSKEKDGTYTLVTDTYVNRDLNDMAKWMTPIKVEYAKAKARKCAREANATFIGQSVRKDGSTVLRFARA